MMLSYQYTHSPCHVYIDSHSFILAEKTKELAHDVKETLVGHNPEHAQKQVMKAVENFEDLKQQLADEEEELREIQRREEIAANTHNEQKYDELKVRHWIECTNKFFHVM